MPKCSILILICGIALAVSGQTSSSKYQPGTITDVIVHQHGNSPGGDDVTRYDVSVKIGNTEYVVLYTPPNGANGVEFAKGLEFLFKIGPDTLTFNSRAGGTSEVPILRQKDLPATPGLDWSKAPGQYFSMKQQHLSEALDLSDEQQAKIKPSLEQETGEVGQIMGNPVLSRADKLNRWEKIVRSSDERIKPFLSQAQLNKLRQMRKEQKQELKKMIEAPGSENSR